MEANSHIKKKIQKPCILITSLGRTGTKFFQALLKSQVPQSCALHEPDVFNFFQYRTGRERIRQVRSQLKESGFPNLVVRKLLGQWSLIDLSDARVCGALGLDEAVNRLWRYRSSFVESKTGTPYIESNAGYYGLLDALDDVFVDFRAVFIVRDGRTWVRSIMNWGQMYSKGKAQRLLAHTWPTAYECGDTSLQEWRSWSKFQQVCWAWVKLNEFAVDSIGDNPRIRLVKFEDIFISENRYQYLEEVLHYLNIDKISQARSPLEGWLEKRIHGSQGSFPDWEDWSPEMIRQFTDTCGPMMERLHYPYG